MPIKHKLQQRERLIEEIDELMEKSSALFRESCGYQQAAYQAMCDLERIEKTIALYVKPVDDDKKLRARTSYIKHDVVGDALDLAGVLGDADKIVDKIREGLELEPLEPKY